MISFAVEGTPAPKGSMRAFRTKRGKVAVTHDNERTRLWEDAVAYHARRAMSYARRFLPYVGAMEVVLTFLLPRPKTVKCAHPTAKNDLDKLTRTVLDALTGIVWEDDGQVVKLTAMKAYADGIAPGVRVHVTEIQEVKP